MHKFSRVSFRWLLLKSTTNGPLNTPTTRKESVYPSKPLLLLSDVASLASFAVQQIGAFPLSPNSFPHESSIEGADPAEQASGLRNF
jgi:hypothetical protein